MPVQQEFGQELSFQSFDTNSSATGYTDQTGYGNNPYLNPSTGGNFTGGIFVPSPGGTGTQKFDSIGNEFEDEPPLLEELGVNPEYILQKGLHQWLSSTNSIPHISKVFLHPNKILLCVWRTATGIVHYEFLERGKTITANLYCEQLQRVQAALIRKQPSLVNRKSSILTG
ncbi:hypothetical protein Trydic_g9619 [Trypoxylus dichotomus]